MSNVKKGVVVIGVIMLLIVTMHFGVLTLINNNNFYAQEASSVEEARDELLQMDLTEGGNFSTKDFYGQYVPDTNFILTYGGRVYYDQGYYMVYKKNYEPVYCIDPLKTAWSVTNKDTLDKMNNHNYSNLSVAQQENVSRLVKATQSYYDETNNPEYLVSGQLLIWQAVGSTLNSYTDTLQDNMDEINKRALSYDFTNVPKGGTGDGLNYYDTDGQDLVGSGNGGGIDTGGDKDIDDTPKEGDITVDKTSALAEGELTNGSEVVYTVKITNNSEYSRDVTFSDALTDDNLKVVDSDPIYINGMEVAVTIGDIKNGILLEDLAPGDSVEISYTAVIDFSETFEVGDTISNTATSCIYYEGSVTDICDDDIETIGGDGDLEVGIASEKTITDENGNNDGIAQVDENITFSILVSNTGSAEITPVVTDELNDPNISYDLNNSVYIDGEESTYTVGDLGSSGVVLPTLQAGEEALVTFEAKVNSEFTFSADSELKITNDSAVCVGEDCVYPHGFIPVGGFEVEKVVSDASGDNVADPSEVLTYKIIIKNYNEDSSTISIDDKISDEYVVVDESAPLTITPAQSTTPANPTVGDLMNGITLNDVKGGEDIEISYEVTTKSDLTVIGGNYHITNSITACLNDDECLDDTSSITIDPSKPVIDGGDQTVIKSITDESGDGVVSPGEKITFNVLMTNGSDSKENFTVTDPLEDPNIDYVDSNPLEEVVGGNGKFVTANPTVGDLKKGVEVEIEPNSHFEFKFLATAKDPLEDISAEYVYNTIDMCSEEGCATGGGKLPLDSAFGFEVNKEVTDANNDGIIQEGETFNYEISVSNVGNDTEMFVLKDVMDTINVDIDLSQSLEIEGPSSVTFNPQNPTLGDLIVDHADLPSTELVGGIEVSGLNPGETVTFKFSGVGLTNMLAGSHKLTNIAQVVWANGDDPNGEDLDSADIYTNEKGEDLLGDVTVSKDAKDASGDGIVAAGEEITYTVSVVNNTALAEEVVVRDLFEDENIEYNMDDNFTVSKSDENATVTGKTLGDLKEGVTVNLPPNSSVNITYTGKAYDKPVNKTALIDYNTVEYCQEDKCNEAEAILDREDTPSFDVKKTAYVDGIEAVVVSDGDIIEYEIIIENTGNVDIPNLKVSDHIDDGLIYDSAAELSVVDSSGKPVATTPSTVTVGEFIDRGFTINSLPYEETITITFEVEAVVNELTDENELLSNIAAACNGTEECISDEATVTTNPDDKPIDKDSPDMIAIVKNIVDDDGVAEQGENLTFNIYIANPSLEDKELDLYDPLDDPNLIYDESEEIVITPNPNNESMTIGDLKAGTKLTIPAKNLIRLSFNAKVKSGDDFDATQSQITNLITGCYKDDDGYDACSEGGGHINLPKTVDFAITKDVLVNDVDTNLAAAGEKLTYNIAIQNIRNTPLEDVGIIDTYERSHLSVPEADLEVFKDGKPASTQPVNPTTTDLFTTGILVEGELRPTSEITFSYDANIDSNLNGYDVKEITNIVGATTDDALVTKGQSFDRGDKLYAFAPATVILDEDYPETDDFAVVKNVEDEDGDGIATAGEEMKYTVYVTNNTDTEQILSLEDFGDINDNVNFDGNLTIFPSDTVITGGSGDLDSLMDGSLEVKIPSLETISLTYTGTVTNPLNDPSASFVYNEIEVCNKKDDCADSDTVTPLEETKGFDIQKDVSIIRGSDTLDPAENEALVGDVLDYTIRVKNNRNTDLTDVVVSDEIDAHILVDSASELDIVDNNGDTVDVTPDNTVGQLMSEEGITISSIPSGGYVEIKFSSLPLTELAINASYNYLTNVAQACTENTLSKSQSIDTENGLCGSDYATVTTDPADLPDGEVGVLKTVTETDSSGASDGIASEGDSLHFAIDILNTSSSQKDINVVDDLSDPNIVYDLSQTLELTPSDLVTDVTNPTLGDLQDDGSGEGLIVTLEPYATARIEFDGTVANPLKDTTAVKVENNVKACDVDDDEDCSDSGIDLPLPRTNGFDIQKTVSINGNEVDPTDPLSYVVANGDSLTYKIALTNNRNLDLANVSVTDVIDNNIIVDFDDAANPLLITSTDTTNPDHNNPASKTVEQLFDGTLVIDRLAVGETVTLAYDAQAEADIENASNDEFQNLAEACTNPVVERGQSITTEDGLLCGASMITVTTDPDGITDPEDKTGILKTVEDEDGDGIATPGENLHYTIRVLNPMKDTQKLVLTDALDDPNVDYDKSMELKVTPSSYLLDPNPARVGDLQDGVTLEIPGDSLAVVEFDAPVFDPLEDTGRNDIVNVAEVCDEDGEDCSTGGNELPLEDNENFTVSKKAYRDGTELTNADIIEDGDTLTFYVQVQNTGNTSLENIRMLDAQDNNFIPVLTDDLIVVDAETTQDSFALSGEKVGDLLVTPPALGYANGVNIPLLDPAKKVTLKYDVTVGNIMEEEVESVNAVQACTNSDLIKGTKGNGILDPATGVICGYDSIKLNLKDNPDAVEGFDVLKIGIDGLKGGTTNLVLEPGEDMTYFVFLINKGTEDISLNPVDYPDENIEYDLTSEVKVLPDSTVTDPNAIKLEDFFDPSNTISIDVPAESVVALQYEGKLKTEDTGLDLTATEVFNTVEACDVDDDEACATGDTSTDILGSTDLTIEKSVQTLNESDFDSDTIYDVQNSEELTYTLHVKNSGNTTIDMTVKDIFPDEDLRINDPSISLAYTGTYETDPENPTVGDIAGDGVVFKDIKPGEEFDITFQAFVKDDLIFNGDEYSGYITNIAQVCSDETECTSSSVLVEYNDPEAPFNPEMAINKKVEDEDGDGIASPGELLTFRVNAFNLTDSDGTFIVSDALSDVNVDYDSALTTALNKVSGVGEFVEPSPTIQDLKDDSSTKDIEGVEVSLPELQNIEFTFTAKVYDPLKENYNTDITNTVTMIDKDQTLDPVDDSAFIDLPGYNRMDVRKSYTTDYVVDTDLDPTTEDNLYYVQDKGDNVYYTVEYKNIGSSPITSFEMKDYLDETYYEEDLAGEVTLTHSDGTTSTITIEEFKNGYEYDKVLEPGETVTASFTVVTNSNILDRDDGYNIVNTALACYDDVTDTDESCTSSSTKTPYHPEVDPTLPPDKPDGSFTIDKWIDDSVEAGGDGDGVLSPSERVKMHILVTNNTDDLEQYDEDGESQEITITDDLIDPNFAYDLNELLTIYNITTGIDITADGDVVNIINAKVENIDKSKEDTEEMLTLDVKDGEVIEITFGVNATSTIS